MARAKLDTTDTIDAGAEPATTVTPITPVPADPIEPRVERILRVTAAADSRWRGGRQFGRAAVDLVEADVLAAAEARGMSPADWLALLAADPVLTLARVTRPIAD